MQDKNDWAPFTRDCSLFFKVSQETQKATKIIKKVMNVWSLRI